MYLFWSYVYIYSASKKKCFCLVTDKCYMYIFTFTYKNMRREKESKRKHKTVRIKLVECIFEMLSSKLINLTWNELLQELTFNSHTMFIHSKQTGTNKKQENKQQKNIEQRSSIHLIADIEWKIKKYRMWTSAEHRGIGRWSSD